MSLSHRSAAEQWRRNHPDGWALIETEALERLARGQKFGMKALIEFVRWHLTYKTRAEARDYKLNNNFTAHFARMLVADHPAIAGLIHMREAGE